MSCFCLSLSQHQEYANMFCLTSSVVPFGVGDAPHDPYHSSQGTYFLLIKIWASLVITVTLENCQLSQILFKLIQSVRQYLTMYNTHENHQFVQAKKKKKNQLRVYTFLGYRYVLMHIVMSIYLLEQTDLRISGGPKTLGSSPIWNGTKNPSWNILSFVNK